MVVGTLRMELLIPDAQSLKDKRRALKSLKDRLRGKFNISVAETDASELWQRAVVGVAAVGDDSRQMNSILYNVTNYVRGFRRVQLLDYEIELI